MSLVRKRYAVIVATSLLATTVLGAGTTLAQSTSAKKVAIPSAGITTVLDSYETAADKKTELEAIVKVNVAASEQKTQKIQSKNTDGDDSIYDDIAISSVENFVNVRKEANTDAEIVGVIYDECGDSDYVQPFYPFEFDTCFMNSKEVKIKKWKEKVIDTIVEDYNICKNILEMTKPFALEMKHQILLKRKSLQNLKNKLRIALE